MIYQVVVKKKKGQTVGTLKRSDKCPIHEKKLMELGDDCVLDAYTVCATCVGNGFNCSCTHHLTQQFIDGFGDIQIIDKQKLMQANGIQH